MRRLRLAWAASAAAPWALAAGVLLSITAEAGQEPARYASAYDRSSLLMAAASPTGRNGIAVEARLSPGGDQADLSESDELQPNGVLKTAGTPFPAVDRTAKGNPFIGLRRGFDVHRRGQDSASRNAHAFTFGVEDPGASDFDPNHSMSPVRPDAAEPAPPAGAIVTDGATPTLPLEYALNSSSPTSSEGVVVEVEAAPETTIASQSPLGDGQPNYATLIDVKDGQRQMRCLAEAVYFESRSEPENGQAAVAQVVLNRVRSGIYPTSICGVVYQDRNRPFACQFSFACEGKSLRVEEPGPWATATRISEAVVNGKTYIPEVAQAVNYHANYVAPFWVGYLRRVDRIGAHIFYAMRDGTAWAPGALNGHGDRP